MDKAESTIALLSRYLELTAERGLEEAATGLAPGALLVFPGGARFASLRHMTEAAQGRYRWARKRIERWDVCLGQDGAAVVYCLGTLCGEDPGGILISVDGEACHDLGTPLPHGARVTVVMLSPMMVGGTGCAG